MTSEALRAVKQSAFKDEGMFIGQPECVGPDTLSLEGTGPGFGRPALLSPSRPARGPLPHRLEVSLGVVNDLLMGSRRIDFDEFRLLLGDCSVASRHVEKVALGQKLFRIFVLNTQSAFEHVSPVRPLAAVAGKAF